MFNHNVNKSEAYLIGTSLQHCTQYASDIDLQMLNGANVVAVFEGGDWLLAKVFPPHEICEVYVYSNGETSHCDVRVLFNEIQGSAVCWAQV